MITSNHKNNALMYRLLDTYDKIMYLKISVNSDDIVLKKMYSNAIDKHNNKIIDNPYHIDPGFELILPGYDIGSPEDKLYNGNSTRYFENIGNNLDLKICCSAIIISNTDKQYNTGYYIHPTSILSKTQLRLANSTVIVNSLCTENLSCILDVVPNHSVNPTKTNIYSISKYARLVQICAPGLIPIIVELIEL